MKAGKNKTRDEDECNDAQGSGQLAGEAVRFRRSLSEAGQYYGEVAFPQLITPLLNWNSLDGLGLQAKSRRQYR